MDCRKCIFAKCEENVQSGCSADRLHKIIDLGKAESTKNKYHDQTYYELKRFCNMYRTESWRGNKEEEELVKIASEEVKATFGIVIYDAKSREIDTTIESIKNIEYNKERIKIVISTNTDMENVHISHLIDKVNEMQFEDYNCIMSVHTYDDNIQMRDYECFSKMQTCSHVLKVPAGSYISKGLFNFVSDSVNSKLEQIALFEDNNEAISLLPWKVVNSEYLNYNEFDKMVEGIKKVASEHNLYRNYENQ